MALSPCIWQHGPMAPLMGIPCMEQLAAMWRQHAGSPGARASSRLQAEAGIALHSSATSSIHAAIFPLLFILRQLRVHDKPLCRAWPAGTMQVIQRLLRYS